MKPNDTSSKDTISELVKSLKGVMFWITVGAVIIRYGKFVISLFGDLFLIAWLALVTAGIWSKDLYLLQVSGTIIMAGLILYALTKLSFTVKNFYYPKKKPDPKPEPKPKADFSAGMGDLMLQTFLIERMQADPAFRKEVVARMTAKMNEEMAGNFKRKQASGSEGSAESEAEVRKEWRSEGSAEVELGKGDVRFKTEAELVGSEQSELIPPTSDEPKPSENAGEKK